MAAAQKKTADWDIPGKKPRERRHEIDRLDWQQRQPDERTMVPESAYKAMTEESVTWITSRQHSLR